MARRDRLLRSAEKLVSRGRLEAGLKEYRKLLSENPDDTNILNRVGDLCARLDRTSEAVALFRRAADHYVEEGFFVKAIAIYKKMLRFDPGLLEVYETLASLYRRQGLTSEARAQYQALAEHYRRRDDRKKIIEIQSKLVDLEPERVGQRVRLAELYQERRLFDEAKEQYSAIAELMLDEERIEEATQVYRRAFSLDPEDLGFITDAVLNLRQRGYLEAASAVIDAAVEQNPEARRVERLVAAASEAEAARIPGQPRVEEAPVADSESEIQLDELPELAPGARAAGDGAIGEGWEFLGEQGEEELELEIEFESVGDAAAETAAAKAEGTVETAELVELGAEIVPEDVQRQSDLLAEAEVFVKYGLQDKAEERLDDVLALNPDNIEACARLVLLYLQQGRSDRVVEAAERLAGLGERPDTTTTWEEVRSTLEAAGYNVEGGRVLPPEVEAEAGAEPEPQPLPATVVAADADLAWLEEAVPEGAESGADEEGLFEAEEEFFDLAAELEKELGEEAEPAELGEETPIRPGEESLEKIVEGFRRGVEEALSPEDYDTHYNLGIAYREMGLLDEAIGEFQLAAKDPRYLLDCCSMLGTCFLEKGFPDLAVKWYRRGLESSLINEEGRLGLLYELGTLYQTIGDNSAALDTFSEIYGTKSNYRDVVAKLEELGHVE